MKKLLSTILVVGLILSTFTACETTANTGEKASSSVTKYTTEGKTNELIPDETMTGELVVSKQIYAFEQPNYDIMEEKYNELYPNVKLTMDYTFREEDGADAYEQTLATEIMSGKGPDVFSVTKQDVHKMMKSGGLADLTTYFENDKTFDVSKYNETILYETQYQGKQYVVPTGYTFSAIHGFADEISGTSFDATKCTDYYTTMEQLLPVIKEHEFFTMNYNDMNISAIYNGLDVFDYGNNSINLDYDMLKKNFEISKEVSQSFEGLDVFGIINLANKLDLNLMLSKMADTMVEQKEVLLLPLKNANGGVTAEAYNLYAVNANSENKQNAYNFIKMIISPDFLKAASEVESIAFLFEIPISNEHIQLRFDNHYKHFTEGTNENTKKLEADFYGMLDLIDSVNIYYEMDEIFLKEIMPKYFEDEATLDECLEEAQRKLERYISE